MSEHIFGVIDIGTSKIGAAIFGASRKGINIKSICAKETDGIVQGAVIEPEKTAATIKVVMKNAIEMADIMPEKVFGILGGSGVKSFVSKGVRVRKEGNRAKMVDAIFKAIGSSEIFSMMPDGKLIDFKFFFENDSKADNDFSEQIYEGDIIAFAASISSVDNAQAAFNMAGVYADELIAGQLAISEGVSSEDRHWENAIIIDIGADVTDILVYIDGKLVLTEAHHLAGNIITQDLVYMLRLSKATAEGLKRNFGNALPEEIIEHASILIPTTEDWESDTINLKFASKVIAARVEEIFELCKKIILTNKIEISKNVFTQGVILTGGGALLHGVDVVASRVFGLPARLAEPQIAIRAPKGFRRHQFATLVGGMLLAYKREILGIDCDENDSLNASFWESLRQWIYERL